jgi:hypothetical protein
VWGQLIAMAIPRQFHLGDDDLLRYLTPILNAVDVPCLVQDFNPGGTTVGMSFITRLSPLEHSIYSKPYGHKSVLRYRIWNCRIPAYIPDPDTERYIDELNGRTLQRIAQFGLPGVLAWTSGS